MKHLAGIDIGGTKCAVSIGREQNGSIELLCKEKFKTPSTPENAIRQMADTLERMAAAHPEARPDAVGISCGGPLDSQKGMILSPPNLQGWDHIDIVTPFSKRFHVPAGVQNDANACALAEWLWGAGKETENMIFLTFGTGLGAGLILNGKLYSGTCDMAGEAGHIRLSENGPEGYGKEGSFEGFCSGGGIARYGKQMVCEWMENGKQTQILTPGKLPEEITAADIGDAAQKGDELALSVMEHTGKMLGRGIAVLLDILNPQCIVIGSIFLRQEALLRLPMEAEIKKEALSYNREVCRIVPAGLGEQLGDYAALSVAGMMLQDVM